VLTTTKPVAANLIQKMCVVTRDNASGSVMVFGAGRSNDIPNFTAADKMWYGSTAGVSAETAVTSFARTVLDDTTAAAARVTLGAEAKYSKIFYIEKPVATSSYPVLSVPFACTITRITHITDVGTVDWNLEERVEATPNTAGTDVYAADEQSSVANSVDTSFNNPGLAANTWLHFSASAVATAPQKLWIKIDYKEA